MTKMMNMMNRKQKKIDRLEIEIADVNARISVWDGKCNVHTRAIPYFVLEKLESLQAKKARLETKKAQLEATYGKSY